MSFDLNYIENIDNQLFTYGNSGSYYFSKDSGETWDLKKIALKTKIKKILSIDQYLLAFFDNGKIFKSTDKGNEWFYYTSISDSLIYAYEFDSKLIIATNKQLILFNNQFEQLSSYNIDFYTSLWNTLYSYKYSLTKFDSKIVVCGLEGKILLLDTNLRFLKEVYLDNIKSGANKSVLSYCKIFNNEFYFLLDNVIFKTNDFKKFNKIEINLPYISCFDFINDNLFFFQGRIGGNIYQINSDSTFSLKYSIKTNVVQEFFQNCSDIFLFNNDILFSGNRDYIAKANSKDSLIKIMSSTYYLAPLGIKSYSVNDSIYYLYNKYNSSSSFPYLYYKLKNNDIIRPVINSNHLKADPSYFNVSYSYIDSISKSLMFLGYSAYTNKYSCVQASLDSVKEEIKQNLYFNYNYTPRNKWVNTINLSLRENKLIIPFNSNSYFTKLPTANINIYDKNFNLLERLIDSNFIYEYLYYKDSTNFSALILNTVTNAYEMKYTTDKGKNWTNIKIYNPSDSLVLKKTLYHKGKEYFAMVLFDTSSSINTFEIFNPQNYEIKKFYQYYHAKEKRYLPNGLQSINCDDSLFYFTIRDTFFIAIDLFDRDTWEYYILPNNETAVNDLEKIGDKFIIPIWNDLKERQVYFLKFVKDTINPPLKINTVSFPKTRINKSNSEYLNITNTSHNKFLIIDSISNTNLNVFSREISNSKIVVPPDSTIKIKLNFAPEQTGEYFDSIRVYSKSGIFTSFISGIAYDSVSNVNELETINYLYCYPPYPQPAKNIVNILIYWNFVFELNDSNVSIYNVAGNQIFTKGKISLEYLNNYSGLIKWNCSDIEPGIYIIIIKHGDKSFTTKTVVL